MKLILCWQCEEKVGVYKRNDSKRFKRVVVFQRSLAFHTFSIELFVVIVDFPI